VSGWISILVSKKVTDRAQRIHSRRGNKREQEDYEKSGKFWGGVWRNTHGSHLYCINSGGSGQVPNFTIDFGYGIHLGNKLVAQGGNKGLE
jgi:hypothetical protein